MRRILHESSCKGMTFRHVESEARTDHGIRKRVLIKECILLELKEEGTSKIYKVNMRRHIKGMAAKPIVKLSTMISSISSQTSQSPTSASKSKS